MTRLSDPRPPPFSYAFGYAAVAPLALAAIGAWTLPRGWPVTLAHLAVIWAALILAFIGGVRRGFGFATPGAGTAAEVAAGLLYVALGGAALLAMPYASIALWPLTLGYALAALLDARAARHRLAPAHFARLRPPQMLLGAAALGALWARLTV